MKEQQSQTNFPKPLQQWIEIVHENLPSLTLPQARVLAMWSFSLVITKRVGVTTNANFLAEYLEQDENTLRQRLREWYWDAEQKRGAKRQELDVARVFPDLLRWVLRLWPPDSKQLVLTMDATTHKDIFVVLSIHVVYRCCAIPIAWKILPGNQPGAWKPHWQALFELLKGVVPADRRVIVLADRGLYAPWWYGFRTWIESGYRDIKRDGWQWQYTRITEPKRAERIWLIMAIAMLWVLNEGGHAEEASSPRKEAPPEEDNDAPQPVGKPFARIISCFLQGLNAILAKLLKGHDIVLRRFAPVQWYSVAPP